MLHTVRRAAWALGALAALAAAVAGFTGTVDVALGLLGVAVLAATGGAFLSFRALADVVREATAPSRRAAAAVGSLAGRGDDADRLDEIVQRRTEPLQAGVAALGRQLNHQPYVVAELHRRYAQLVGPTDEPMPVLGANWAATAPTVLFIVDEVLGPHARRTMLECGSGASTVWTAAALRHRGDGGHVWSLESDAAYAEITRDNLRRHGLEAWATVVDAPLVLTPVPGQDVTQPWYSLAALPPDLTGFDLMFVDGPPGSTARFARLPAVPRMLPVLRDGALVVLDDTDRPREREIVRRWAADGISDRPLRVVRTVGRSTVLEVGARR